MQENDEGNLGSAGAAGLDPAVGVLGELRCVFRANPARDSEVKAATHSDGKAATDSEVKAATDSEVKAATF